MSDDHVLIRELPGGRGVWVDQLIGDRARLQVGALDSTVYDDGW